MNEMVVRIIKLEAALDRWKALRERMERESRFPCFGYKTKRYIALMLTQRIDESSVLIRELYSRLEK